MERKEFATGFEQKKWNDLHKNNKTFSKLQLEF